MNQTFSSTLNPIWSRGNHRQRPSDPWFWTLHVYQDCQWENHQRMIHYHGPNWNVPFPRHQSMWQANLSVPVRRNTWQLLPTSSGKIVIPLPQMENTTTDLWCEIQRAKNSNVSKRNRNHSFCLFICSVWWGVLTQWNCIQPIGPHAKRMQL